MWLIRQAQMDALRAHHRQELEDQAVTLRLGQDGGDPSRVRDQVRQTIREALVMGFRKKPEILRWVDVTRALTMRPERTAWANEILTDADLTPALKLSMLEDGIGPNSL